MIQIQVDGAGAIVADFADAPRRVTKAAVRALNRAMLAARTDVVKGMAGDTGLKSGDLKNALILKEANWSQSEPYASLSASLKRLPLIHFNAKGPIPSRGKGRGVSWRTQGSTKRVQDAFITTVASPKQTAMGVSHTGVFRRVRGSRLPIKQLYGPSLGHVFAKFRPLGLAKAREAFEKNFAHELAYETQQGSGGA